MMPALLIILVVADSWPPGQAEQPDPKLVRVWVTTDAGGHPEDLAGRQESLKHLTEALARQKKLVTIVEREELADLSVEVRERRVDVPRFVFGIGARPGDPPGMIAPARTAQVLVRLEWQDDRVEFKNKNKPIESPFGWTSAADDLAKQIEKWISERRQRILDARRGGTLSSPFRAIEDVRHPDSTR
jgi:hypothetical protein